MLIAYLICKIWCFIRKLRYDRKLTSGRQQKLLCKCSSRSINSREAIIIRVKTARNARPTYVWNSHVYFPEISRTSSASEVALIARQQFCFRTGAYLNSRIRGNDHSPELSGRQFLQNTKINDTPTEFRCEEIFLAPIRNLRSQLHPIVLLVYISTHQKSATHPATRPVKCKPEP